MLEWVDADPDAISAQLEEEADKGVRTDLSPSLAPDAKRGLLVAYEESQALGSSYIGPEHVVLALTRGEESEAGRLLSRFGVSHTKLRGAVVRGVGQGARRGNRPAQPLRWLSSAAILPRWPRRASLIRSSGARTR